ncbi:G-protein coupled receptor Mth2-like isoform X1 [Macrobrachium nipponense]|uniref:G-protein coupled receptor Mth2-like isoform X1 n=1 Tax=Macrobrachium nipponense TaxID=159736 RepID=UPI0030C8A26B
MRPRKPQVGYSLNSKGYFGSSRVLCSTAGLFLFLLINKSCCAQKDLNSSYIYQEDPNYSQTEDSYHGELCCPDDQYFGEGRCISFNNSEKFQPPALPSNVLWTYQGFQCPPGYDPTPIEYKNNSLTLDEGSVSLRWRNLLRKTTKQFCLSLLPTDAYIGVICRPNNEKLCAGATCIQKCCDIGDAVSLDTVECLPDADRNFTLTFQSVSGLSVLPPTNLQLLHRIPDCQPLVLLDPENNVHEHFFLTVDGYLYQPAKENTFHENRFCLDYFTTGGVTGERMRAFVCTGPGLPTEPSLKFHFYAAGLMISAVSLTVIILCNNLIAKLRAVQDLNQLSHMIALLVGEIALFTGYVFTNEIHSDHCVINSIIGQFALLSAFFWLNVMCFDIHQYVRATLKLIPRSTIQGRRGLRFKCYSAYAWGIPFLITLATTILHYFPDYPDHIILRPGFGVKSCWFYGDIERLTFFYVWVGVLFIGNIFLLAHTAYMLHKTGVTLSCGRKKSIFEDGENHVSNRRNVERFWQSFNLFALMALCWVTEILSWKIPPEPLWIPTDIINTLQGFFIFLFFLRLKTKRDIVKEAILSFSEKARKLSRSEGNSNTFWHCNRSLTVVTDFERHHTEFAKDSSDQQL